MVLLDKLVPGLRNVIQRNVIEVVVTTLSDDDIAIQGALVLGRRTIIPSNESGTISRKSDPRYKINLDDTTDTVGGMYMQVKTPNGTMMESVQEGESRTVGNFGDKRTVIALRHHR